MQGRPCDPFPEPTEPFEAKPFFGKYASTGAPGGGDDPLSEDGDEATDTTGERRDEGRGGQEVPAQSVRVPAAARADARAPGGGGDEQESAPVNPTGGVGIG